MTSRNKESVPPPLPKRIRVEVWEYLEDGIWSSMGKAFMPYQQDPFWVFLIRICPWWSSSNDKVPGEVEDFDIRPWQSTEWQGASKSHATLVPTG